MRLPHDLVEDILYKTPAESLVRFKLTCKQWYVLFNDHRFIYKHLDHFQGQSRFIRVYLYKVQILNPTTSEILSLPFSPVLSTITCVIHCDGLLLCQCYNGVDTKKLAVWNPVLGQIKWIQPFHPYPALDIFGFGYDSEGYKILRYPRGRGTEFEIYDFKSKVWRILLVNFDWTPFNPIQNVSMKGNMYWIARKNRSSEHFIQSFDFSKETFKPICSFLPFELGVNHVIVALSGLREDRLSLLHQDLLYTTRKIEVWVTNKVTDEVVTWSKYFSVTSPALPLVHHRYYNRGNPSFFIHKTNSIMLWCDKIVEDDYACPSFCEIGEGEIKKVETGSRFSDFEYVSCGCAYVPSLVPVPE